MKFLFFLSGEHPTLPQSEVKALLKAQGIDYSVVEIEEQVLVIEAEAEIEDIRNLTEKLALTHSIGRLLFSCDYDEIEEQNYNYKFKGSFCVRIWRIGSVSVKASYLERYIGGRIADYGKKVDLKKHENLFIGIAGKKFYLSEHLASVPRGEFEKRRAHLRPYYRPGAMHPRLSRVIVNLTGIKAGEFLCDPFCGGGGFLIEAGLIGAKVYGFDIDDKAIKGAERNLKYAGIYDFNLEVEDILKLEGYNEYFHAIVSDPPYGISSSTGGLKKEELYNRAIEKIYKMLKPQRYACFIIPLGDELENLEGFKVVEKHYLKVHRSLTRVIMVMKKWK